MCSSRPRREALPSEVRSAVISAVSRKKIGSIGADSLSGKEPDAAGGVTTMESTTVATGAGDCAGSGGRGCSVVQPIENMRVDVIVSTLTLKSYPSARLTGQVRDESSSGAIKYDRVGDQSDDEDDCRPEQTKGHDPRVAE
jgi:hypothetical protein